MINIKISNLLIQMKNIYFISCGNIVVISSSALYLFPQIQNYVFGFIKPNKSDLFFILDKHATKNTFNSIEPIGFANASEELEYIRISELISITKKYKQDLLEYILEFYLKTLILEIKFDNINWYEDIVLYAKMGFGAPTPNPNSKSIDLLHLGMTDIDPAVSILKIMNIAQSQPFLCRQKIFFSKRLARLLAKFCMEPVEYAAKLCISKYIRNINGADIGVIELNTDLIIQGNESSVPLIGNESKLSYLSFHSHPDRYYADQSGYISWPSGPDMATQVTMFVTDNNILAHFVASSEGLWMVHLRPKFQKLLYDLKTDPNAGKCIEYIIAFVREAFGGIEGLRYYNIVPIDKRASVRRQFIHVSKNLKMSDFKGTDLANACAPFIKEDALLFDVDLFKWELFDSNQVVMEFSYILDPKGGFYEKHPVDCSERAQSDDFITERNIKEEVIDQEVIDISGDEEDIDDHEVIDISGDEEVIDDHEVIDISDNEDEDPFYNIANAVNNLNMGSINL